MADPAPKDEGWYLEPASRWRGLDPDRDGVKYNPQKLAGLAKTLNEELAKLTGFTPGPVSVTTGPVHGSSADLSMNTDLSMMTDSIRGVKDWPGGHEFANALDKAHASFPTTYENIIATAQKAIALISEGAGKYGITDVINGGTSG